MIDSDTDTRFGAPPKLKTYAIKSRGGADSPILKEITADWMKTALDGLTIEFYRRGELVLIVGVAQMISIEVRGA